MKATVQSAGLSRPGLNQTTAAIAAIAPIESPLHSLIWATVRQAEKGASMGVNHRKMRDQRLRVDAARHDEPQRETGEDEQRDEGGERIGIVQLLEQRRERRHRRGRKARDAAPDGAGAAER